MKKAIRNWNLAIIMGVLGAVEATSGFVLWLGLPTGGNGHGFGSGTGASNLTYWGLSRHTWINIHDWVAVALVILISVHIILHWKWIARMVRTIFQGQTKEVVPVLAENR